LKFNRINKLIKYINIINLSIRGLFFSRWVYRDNLECDSIKVKLRLAKADLFKWHMMQVSDIGAKKRIKNRSLILFLIKYFRDLEKIQEYIPCNSKLEWWPDSQYLLDNDSVLSNLSSSWTEDMVSAFLSHLPIL
jgi:hypothetical protein